MMMEVGSSYSVPLEAASRPPLTVEEVYETLRDVNSVAKRGEAEGKLAAWEVEVVPGYLTSLLRVAANFQGVPPDTRLLAMLVAKNVVGSSWRKTVGTREWSRVAGDEKQVIRQMSLQLLFEEPEDKIALQTALFIANIARFDFPLEWPEILTLLLEAIASDTTSHTLGGVSASVVCTDIPADLQIGHTPQLKNYRGAVALKHVLKALMTKNVVSLPNMSSIQMVLSVAQSIPDRIAQIMPRLSCIWELHMRSFISAGNSWHLHSLIALKLTQCLTSCLLLTSATTSTTPYLARLSHWISHHSSFLLGLYRDKQQHQQIETEGPRVISKSLFRIAMCLYRALERHALDLAPMITTIVDLFALICVEAPVESPLFHPQRMMIVTRFLTHLLLNRWEEYWKVRVGFCNDASKSEKLQQASIINQELDKFFNADRCRLLMEALIAKYLRLRFDELADWQGDPEAFLSKEEQEDTPRFYAQELLIGLMDRFPDIAVDTLGRFGSQLRLKVEPFVGPGAAPFSSKTQSVDDEDDDEEFQNLPEDVLYLDGCYRAMGLALTVVDPQKFNFSEWYMTELSQFLQRPPGQNMAVRLLQSRALWVISRVVRNFTAWSPELRFRLLSDASYSMKSPDLIVALNATLTLCMIVARITMEREDKITSAAYEQQRQIIREERNNSTNAEHLSRHSQMMNQIALQQQKIRAIMSSNSCNDPNDISYGITDDLISHIFESCFHLLQNLGTVETKVYIFNLLKGLVVFLGVGDRLAPHLPTLVKTIPGVWSNLQFRQDERLGGEQRLQKSIVDLVSRIIHVSGPVALQNPDVASILQPMLLLITDPSSPTISYLLDETISLWTEVLVASASLGDADRSTSIVTDLSKSVLGDFEVGLISRLFQFLQPDAEPHRSSPVLDLYLVLGGPLLLQQFGGQLLEVLSRLVQPKTLAVVASSLEIILTLYPGPGSSLFMPLLQQFVQIIFDNELVVRQLKQRHQQMMQQGRVHRVGSNSNLDDNEPTPLDGKLIKLMSTLLCRAVLHDPRNVAVLCRNDPDTERQLIELWLDMDNRRNIAFVLSGFSIEMPDSLEVRLPHSLVLLEALTQRHPVALSSVASIVAVTISVMTQKESQTSQTQAPSELLQGLERRLLAIESTDPVKVLDLHRCLVQAVDAFLQVSNAADLEEKLNALSPSLSSILRKILNGESASAATSEDDPSP